MDYTLAALKILCSHLNTATETTSHSQPAFSLGGILFQRAWLQGVLISKPSPSDNDAGRFLLDDGTGVIELKLSGDYLQNDTWELGMYVMVVGGYSVRKDGTSFIKRNIQGPLKLCSRIEECSIYFWNLLKLYRAALVVEKEGLKTCACEAGTGLPTVGRRLTMVHKIVDLSPVPDREAMWYLEVVEAFKLFYQPLIEEYNSE